MPEAENREGVVVLTSQYRVIGEMQRGPDGSLWDFKHRGEERFILVHNVQFFSLLDGQRLYDADKVEISKEHVVAVFRQEDVGFVADLSTRQEA